AMRPSFNTSGPCFADEHYMLPPERRLGEVMELIDEHKFFTFTAGRQTGKTTSGMWIEEHLNKTGAWRALWVDIQTSRQQPDLTDAFRALLSKIDEVCGIVHPDVTRPNIEELLRSPARAVGQYLAFLAGQGDRPWVILFDEADCLVGNAMVSFLTQLRDGYISRRRVPFPASVVLIGQRQVRDYALREEDWRTLTWLGTTSPFNITAQPMTLGPFTEPEVRELLEQHTAKTGQRFEPEAIARIYELGQGHPWLTNAMADQIVRRDVKDRAVAITVDHVDAAKETIIIERRTHIDSLMAKLREERVRKVLDPLLAGDSLPDDVLNDDIAYLIGLGLVRAVKRGGGLEIANPVYREVIPRALNYVQQISLRVPSPWYVKPNGSLDMGKLMADWQVFWRKDGHLAAEGFFYRESGPHLMLMAFLQRIINGGGRIEREYGLGRGALDILVCWKEERHAIELKIRRDMDTETEALEQIVRYLDELGLSEGWLVMFDLRKELSWQDKQFVREVQHNGKLVRFVGC
ncbi:MAG TPA: endonuclease NucS, partial [Polyangium sp.]|nr:endonuclease NucS [Polyangium sp.]